MSSNVVYRKGRTKITVAAGEKIAVASVGTVKLYQNVGSPGVPSQLSLVQEISNREYVSSAFTNATEVLIENYSNATLAMYETGVNPIVKDYHTRQSYQPSPNTLNTTGNLTAAMILGGLITSTTAAAVTGTMNLGSVMELASEWAVDEFVDWTVVNTGGTNAFTVAGSSGHTLVGSGTVAASTSATFRTRKSATNTFVTYRLTA